MASPVTGSSTAATTDLLLHSPHLATPDHIDEKLVVATVEYLTAAKQLDSLPTMPFLVSLRRERH